MKVAFVYALIIYTHTQQAVQYLSLLQGVVLCAFGIQILSTARYTVIIALSLTSHHATPISVGTPVNTSGWISQEKHTHNYQDAQVKYQRYHCVIFVIVVTVFHFGSSAIIMLHSQTFVSWTFASLVPMQALIGGGEPGNEATSCHTIIDTHGKAASLVPPPPQGTWGRGYCKTRILHCVCIALWNSTDSHSSAIKSFAV